jgi:hypothetical protein
MRPEKGLIAASGAIAVFHYNNSNANERSIMHIWKNSSGSYYQDPRAGVILF